MNIADLEVVKGLVAQSNIKTPQMIQVTAATADVTSGLVSLEWHNVDNSGAVKDRFATAYIIYGNAEEWLTSWVPTTHLVQGRIEALERMAREGTANSFSNRMAYTLFANNLVDYADKYRGMQAVVLNDFEAFADITLSRGQSGTWTVPPYFIDSVAHLAGFIMNVSDASDTAKTFCVTPGWHTMRFARPLLAGHKYRSYVKMIPTTEDPSVYLGDVYILQDKMIVGMVGGIQFRRYPRILLNRFFSPPDTSTTKAHSASTTSASVSSSQPAPPRAAPATVRKSHVVAPPSKLTVTAGKAVSTALAPTPASSPAPSRAEAKESKAAPTPTDADPDSTAAKAMVLVANELGIEATELEADTSFANLGVDSLMSLVLSEKFREDLGIVVGSSLFLEYPTVGDLKAWLEEYYS